MLVLKCQIAALTIIRCQLFKSNELVNAQKFLIAETQVKKENLLVVRFLFEKELF